MHKMLFTTGLGRPRWVAASKMLALAAAMVLPYVPVRALQAAATFNVSITLHPAPQTGSCGTDGVGDKVTVACSSGSYRFIANLKKDELSMSGDGYAGTGTSTAYRLVSLLDRQYIEMTVGW
jgi:hypothetical protein